MALVAAVGLGAGGLLFGFLLTIAGAITLLGFGLELTPTMRLVLGLVFVQGIGCAGVTFAYLRARPRVGAWLRERLGRDGAPSGFRVGASVPGVRELAVVGGGYVLALAGAGIGAVLVSRTGAETGTNQAAQMGMENPETLLLLIPASFLIIGPGEELLFRGVVQGRLREVFRPGVAIVLASVVFAGLHWFAISGGTLTGNLLGLAVLVVPALILGTSYEYTDNVVVPSLIHGAYNATLFAGLYVSVVYGGQVAALL